MIVAVGRRGAGSGPDSSPGFPRRKRPDRHGRRAADRRDRSSSCASSTTVEREDGTLELTGVDARDRNRRELRARRADDDRRRALRTVHDPRGAPRHAVRRRRSRS